MSVRLTQTELAGLNLRVEGNDLVPAARWTPALPITNEVEEEQAISRHHEVAAQEVASWVERAEILEKLRDYYAAQGSRTGGGWDRACREKLGYRSKNYPNKLIKRLQEHRQRQQNQAAPEILESWWREDRGVAGHFDGLGEDELRAHRNRVNTTLTEMETIGRTNPERIDWHLFGKLAETKAQLQELLPEPTVPTTGAEGMSPVTVSAADLQAHVEDDTREQAGRPALHAWAIPGTTVYLLATLPRDNPPEAIIVWAATVSTLDGPEHVFLSNHQRVAIADLYRTPGEAVTAARDRWGRHLEGMGRKEQLLVRRLQGLQENMRGVGEAINRGVQVMRAPDEA